METVRSWLRWAYNEIITEEFFDSLVDLENAMQKEKLGETKAHEVLEAVILIQEIKEDPLNDTEMIFQDMENRNEFIIKELQKLQENIIRRKEEVEELCKKNNATLEEIKEISEVLNHGEQIISENEEQLRTNQIVPMNIRNSAKMKKKKKAQKQHLAGEKKKELYDGVRLILVEPKLTKQEIQEFLKNHRI
jgi:hypothetical protein